jgi:hypothetical protein
MMPTDFPQRNFVYTKPKDMTDEQCSDLPVWKGEVPIDDAGKEDIEEIQRTGVIWLSVTGYQQPPVSLFTENPFVLQLEK